MGGFVRYTRVLDLMLYLLRWVVGLLFKFVILIAG